MRILLKLLGAVIGGLSVLALIGVGGGLYLLHRYSGELPDHRQLADYQPPTVTRIHAADGRLLAEYAHEKRVFVPVEAMPSRLIEAFLAAEDKNFYSHPGVDVTSILRAAWTNLAQLMSDRRPVGASTITQQVAKNFLLTNDVTIERKIKEALLAFRIERALTKDQILELYLNQIYLGVSSYGVAAAALNYFDKSLDDLTIPEAAFLAGLPKAPSRYHPTRRPAEAKGRRDWVIGRMREVGFITAEEAERAIAEPLVMRGRAPTEIVTADYFTEEVRRRLVERHGEAFLYQGGLSIRTTLAPELQTAADQALQAGLIAYDRRHGWRGATAQMELDATWPQQLARHAAQQDFAGGLDSWQLAVVLDVADDGARFGLADGSEARLPLAHLTWARPALAEGKRGPEVTSATQVVAPGDLIWVEALPPESAGDGEAEIGDAEPRWGLRQVPAVDGAVVALDPHTGRVLAMTGGFSFAQSVFNRATQALRQPGSALKPFVYLAGLEAGFTPSSILLDAPIVVDQGPGLGKWKPVNYSGKFYGPSTLRLGIEKSRNVMTVRLAQAIGMDRIVAMARRFGLDRGLGLNLASALGSNEVDLLELVSAYATLVNGGKRVEPTLLEHIQDRHGRTVSRRDERPCPDCLDVAWANQPSPVLVDQREQVIDPPRAYQMVNLLRGVVERGTGRRALSIGKPVAGKTGTSNDSKDAWFIGFTPDLVVGVYVGFDQPRSLGRDEQGASAALPIFVEVMEAAVADAPATPFRVPPGVRLVRVDGDTGLLPGPNTESVILEAFLPGTEPTKISTAAPQIARDEGDPLPTTTAGTKPQTGGLY